MIFVLCFSHEARNQLKRLKTVGEALKKLQMNPKHPDLQIHEFYSLHGPRGEKVFEVYAENNTPGAYRIFWCYGPEKGTITILAITPRP
jgi:hypothetical protein